MAIAKCPECQEEVSVPSASAQARVQCPLCDAEYELSVFQDLLPPELKVLSDPYEQNDSELEMAPVQEESSSPAAFAFDEEAAPSRSVADRALSLIHI